MSIPDLLIQTVTKDYQKELLTPYKWAEIEVIHGDVYLHIGHKKPNGERMVKLLSRKYYINGDGTVKTVNIGGDGSGL